MERITPLILLLVFVIIASCAPIPVVVNHERSFDLTKHKTYNLIKNEQDDLVNLGMDKSIIDSIVTETLVSELDTKGFQKSSTDPELLVSYYLVTNAKTDFYVLNDYYSHLGYQPPNRSSTRDSFHLQETTYEEGILIIDIIDAASKQRIWQGHLTSRQDVYRDEKRKEKRLQNGVSKILSYLPSVIK